jgi:Lrp/AsnC family leucine-responsive transcriptional regulator
MMKLDEIDLRMLEILRNNARISVLNLADRVSLSPTPCSRRLKRLEDEGVIEKYTALINPAALGFDVTAFIGVRVRHSPKWGAKLKAAMQQLPNIRGCYTVTGNYDFLLCVNVKDMASLTQWVHDKLYSIPQVLHSYTTIVLETIKPDQ